MLPFCGFGQSFDFPVYVPHFCKTTFLRSISRDGECDLTFPNPRDLMTPATTGCSASPVAAPGKDHGDADEDVDGVQVDADRPEQTNNITIHLTLTSYD